MEQNQFMCRWYNNIHFHQQYINLFRDMNIELDNLTDWFRANKLSLNVTKTMYMLFTSANTEQRHMKLTMTNTIITKTKCVNCLGVLIDEKLKWDEHIKTVNQKINRSFLADRLIGAALCRSQQPLRRSKQLHCQSKQWFTSNTVAVIQANRASYWVGRIHFYLMMSLSLHIRPLGATEIYCYVCDTTGVIFLRHAC